MFLCVDVFQIRFIYLQLQVRCRYDTSMQPRLLSKPRISKKLFQCYFSLVISAMSWWVGLPQQTVGKANLGKYYHKYYTTRFGKKIFTKYPHYTVCLSHKLPGKVHFICS